MGMCVVVEQSRGHGENLPCRCKGRRNAATLFQIRVRSSWKGRHCWQSELVRGNGRSGAYLSSVQRCLCACWVFGLSESLRPYLSICLCTFTFHFKFSEENLGFELDVERLIAIKM